MKYETITLLTSIGLAAASPIVKIGPRMLRGREVPQEHSHEQFITTVRASLQLNNPNNIQDPIFGLLGNAAAAPGQGSISNTDCLHQATADQAFTNAKTAGDVNGMTAALIYAALERNTGGVGVASVLCTAIAAKNPEIAAISQHQDPSSTGAAASNKAVTLALAKQIVSVGGDPQLALNSGTFAPGTVGDPTAKGNSCDTQNDPVGCIFTQNLLVVDATPAEISAAVAGMSVAPAPSTAAAASQTAAAVASGSCPAPVTVTMMVTVGASSPTIPSVAAIATQASSVAPSASVCSVSFASTSTASAASGSNVQPFTGALGGISPPVIFTSGSARPFSVDGSTFVNSPAAIQRSCSVQHNQCANAANAGILTGGEAHAKLLRRATLDFGSCSNPAIEFGVQADRPGASAFIAANQGVFNHGSALNIGVVAGFICQRLGSPCNAAADAIAACSVGQTAAQGKTGQQAADAFNKALGVGIGETASETGSVASSAGTTASASVVPCVSA